VSLTSKNGERNGEKRSRRRTERKTEPTDRLLQEEEEEEDEEEEEEEQEEEETEEETSVATEHQGRLSHFASYESREADSASRKIGSRARTKTPLPKDLTLTDKRST